MRRQDRTEPKVSENSAWEIIYEKSSRKPLYYNKVSKLIVTTRPRCLDSKSGARVSIKQPLVQVQYKESWYKGILMGPGDKESFMVKLRDKIPEAGILMVHRNGVRQWSSPRKLSPTAKKFKLRKLSSDLDEDLLQSRRKTSFVESDDEEDSLSKLSDNFPRSFEKINWQEDEKVEESLPKIKPVLEVDEMFADRRAKLTLSSPWSTTEEDVESDEPLSLTPIRTFPKSQSKRRKERMNAVLLNWGDFERVCREDERKLLPASDSKNIDLDGEPRRPSIVMETSV